MESCSVAQAGGNTGAQERPWWRPGFTRRSTASGFLSGLLGGGCCVAGAAVVGLGIVGSAAASGFIQSYMPYFVVASVIAMAVQFGWMIRRSGFHRKAVLGHLAHHGIAMALVYVIVLSISMAVAAAAGI
jgi:hypothetical protein